MSTPNKPRRRKVRDSRSQEDMISQFESGEGVSSRSRRMLDDLKTRDKSKQSDVHDQPLFSTSSEVDRILMDYIQPQADNPRYLPVKIPRDNNPETLSALDDCVVCEKGILENRLSKDNPRFNIIDIEVEKIKELAESLRHNELIQPITVWRANMSNYPIVSGHRRYYAIRYLYGGTVKVKTKIYPSKPKNIGVLRHIENFSRRDLTAPDTLKSYMAAISELSTASDEEAFKRNKLSIVCTNLGISKTHYYRLEKLADYSEQVFAIWESGLDVGLNVLSAEIKKAEQHGGEKSVSAYLDSLQKNKKFHIFLEPTKPKGRGRTKQFISLPKVKVENTGVVKRLLTEDMTKLDIGIDWDDVDFDDALKVEQVLKKVIASLSKT